MPLNFIDHGDNTLTIPKQKTEAFYGFTDEVTVEGIGSVNPITREISMTLTFNDELDFFGKNTISITFKPE